MTTTHSAPGKIYLFDEHAIAYDMIAINPHTTTTFAEANQTDQVKNNGNRNGESKINAQTPKELENTIKKE